MLTVKFAKPMDVEMALEMIDISYIVVLQKTKNWKNHIWKPTATWKGPLQETNTVGPFLWRRPHIEIGWNWSSWSVSWLPKVKHVLLRIRRGAIRLDLGQEENRRNMRILQVKGHKSKSANQSTDKSTCSWHSWQTPAQESSRHPRPCVAAVIDFDRL